MAKTTCTVDGCANTAHARGYCQTHYTRWRKGTPMDAPVRQLNTDPEGSFTARTERRGACLVWTGANSDTGYGIIWVNGKLTRAHRYAWERTNGPITDGADIDHICGNRACCEVTHLRVTTRKQNMENLTRANTNSPSGVRGVHRDGKRWRVRVKHNYVEHYGGVYDTIAEAEAVAIELRNQLFTHNDRDRIAG